ncbi:MAG: sulfotransferase domain-containing protein [Acidobacteriota bacterium]
MEKNKFKYIIVASHRRSGTHWLIDSIFNNLKGVNHGYINLDRLLTGSPENINVEDFKKKIITKKKTILKTHTPGNFEIFEPFVQQAKFIKEEIIPQSKIIYIYRDGRDVMTSLYYYMLRSKKIGEISFNEFLETFNNFDEFYLIRNRIEFYKYHIDSWMLKKNIYTLNYESLHLSYLDSLKSISEYLGLPLKNKIDSIKLSKYNRIQRAIRRFIPGIFKTTAVLPRVGKTGDWRNSFDNNSKEIYKKYSGEILVELGYEKDNNW